MSRLFLKNSTIEITVFFKMVGVVTKNVRFLWSNHTKNRRKTAGFNNIIDIK